MFELVTYAASPSQLEEVVGSGADAVCLNFRGVGTRKSAGAFSRQELSAAIRYCHVRGVKVYASFESIYTDDELPSLSQDLVSVSEAGVDAVRLCDPGAALIARDTVPEVPLHAAPSLCASTPNGMRLAAMLGFDRFALGSSVASRELRTICATVEPETELTVLSKGCAAVPGRCYLSSFLGGASAGGATCSNTCRTPFGRGRSGCPPLCANPVSLLGRMDELRSSGLTAAMIDTREIRPDLVCAIVGIFYRAKNEGIPVSEAIQRNIAAAFGAVTVCEGLYSGRNTASFFAKQAPEPPGRSRSGPPEKLPELKRVDVRFSLQILNGQPAKLTAADLFGNTAIAEGIAPAEQGNASAEAALRTQLYRTGATPYRCVDVKLRLDRGLIIEPDELGKLRDRALLQLTALRGTVPSRKTGTFTPGKRIPSPVEQPRFSVELSSRAQLSPELAELKPARLYLPISDISISQRQLEPFYRNRTEICAVLPNAPAMDNLSELSAQLSVAHDLGLTTALAGDPDSAALARSEGFGVRGDWGMNINNSLALRACSRLGLISATVSFGLTAERIKDLSHELETEMLIYGRVPLMVTEPCLIKHLSGACSCSSMPIHIKDHHNVPYPLLRDSAGCRNILCDSRKLFPRSLSEVGKLGVQTLRLRYTTENARECADTTAAFMSGKLKMPNAVTYGNYFKKGSSFISRLLRDGSK